MKCLECDKKFESEYPGDDVCQPCIDKEDAANEANYVFINGRWEIREKG